MPKNTAPKLSPMMQQYFTLKEKYRDTIILFRLGDFYEMFFDDAVTASKVLELTLTGRDCGLEERAPMCGVPYHAVDGYVAKLVENGFKVAICEQLTDPKESKGLVERDIIRVVTSGTLTESSMMEEKKNNYLMALTCVNKVYGIAWADVSTGAFFAEEASTEEELADVLALVKPSELLQSERGDIKTRKPLPYSGTVSRFDAWAFSYDSAFEALCRKFNVNGLECFDCGDLHAGICAAGGLLEYLKYTQRANLAQIGTLTRYHNTDYLMLDSHTRANLELTGTLRGKGKKGSLLYQLDNTRTAMGGRMLRSFIEQPLRSKSKIDARLEAVNELFGSYAMRCSLAAALDSIYDIERLATKAAYGSINPHDCLALAQSLDKLPALKDLLCACTSTLLNTTGNSIDLLTDIARVLDSAIDAKAPVAITDGGIFKDDYDGELKKLRDLSHNGAQYIADMEARERERTGIRTLRISYNRVFGYYIEVSKGFMEQVPVDYERRQTLATGERYVTNELKKLEQELLSVNERSVKLEYDLFVALRERLSGVVRALQADAAAVALADTLLAFAEVASEHGYVKPEIITDGTCEIISGRHPVVEAMLEHGGFVPNDTLLDTDKNRLMIITGPNMAGKSTYMRQVALITLMAQMGSFVPAASARISVCDRIFTRVGASDDLSSGQSTFMMEMNEVATILNNCTRESLVVLDEIGRGTSTFDGLSIAWAVTEYMANKQTAGCKTMFATHYHELSELEGELEGVKNYCVQVHEHGEDVIFLRKIIRGSADKSFGIAVARLAGLPKPVLKRAKEILKRLEEADISRNNISASILNRDNGMKNATQLSMFASSAAQEIIDTLLATDVNELTPVKAFNLVCELRETAKRDN